MKFLTIQKEGKEFIHYDGGFIGEIVHKENGTFVIVALAIGNIINNDPREWFHFYSLLANSYLIEKQLKPIISSFEQIKVTFPTIQYLDKVEEVKKLLSLSPFMYGLKGFDSNLVIEIYQDMINDI